MINKVVTKLFLLFRELTYSSFSNCRNITGKFKAIQPVVLRGKGKINFGKGVTFGIMNSPHFFNTYAYVEARGEDSIITIGDNVHINNAFSVTSERAITIKNNVLIGYNCSIVDSNFHDLNSTKRSLTDPNPQPVIIGENVFIGNNVSILKGLTIGDNSVIASNAVVTKSFSSNVVIAGIPAKIINKIEE
ncbi:acyltransferase [Winogradskyella sp.]|uniref:acyltransferase n=1 Tax=Winogradskyella sp. TaxID=1883156 RepID=UPI003F6AA728